MLEKFRGVFAKYGVLGIFGIFRIVFLLKTRGIGLWLVVRIQCALVYRSTT
jgi:hypothetical protein